jgi:hypothetical protein
MNSERKADLMSHWEPRPESILCATATKCGEPENRCPRLQSFDPHGSKSRRPLLALIICQAAEREAHIERADPYELWAYHLVLECACRRALSRIGRNFTCGADGLGPLSRTVGRWSQPVVALAFELLFHFDHEDGGENQEDFG